MHFIHVYTSYLCGFIEIRKSSLLTENLRYLVLDVKCGVAALSQDRALTLAQLLVNTCHGLGIDSIALITNMDAPLGYAVGNSVEVAEAISCLCGKGPEDLLELVCEEGKNCHVAVCCVLGWGGCLEIAWQTRVRFFRNTNLHV